MHLVLLQRSLGLEFSHYVLRCYLLQFYFHFVVGRDATIKENGTVLEIVCLGVAKL